MSKISQLIVFVLSALVVTACQTAREAHYGSGPLTLSDRAQTTFKEYLGQIDPGVFIVSEDGRYWTYTYCDAAMCEWNDINNFALMRCAARMNPVPCKIYADRTTIVWRFDQGSPPQQNRQNATPPKPPVTSFYRSTHLETLPVFGVMVRDWRAIARAETRMMVIDDASMIADYHARQTKVSGTGGERYQERMRLGSGGTFFYEVLLGARDQFEPGDRVKEHTLTAHAKRLSADFGITIAAHDIASRRLGNSELFYAVLESSTSVCFVGDSVFGLSPASRPTRHLEIFICRLRNSWTRAQLEKYVLDLVGRMRFDQNDNAPFADRGLDSISG